MEWIKARPVARREGRSDVLMIWEWSSDEKGPRIAAQWRAVTRAIFTYLGAYAVKCCGGSSGDLIGPKIGFV